MVQANLQSTFGADARASAHEQNVVFVILFGYVRICWVQAKTPVMEGCRFCAL